MEEGPGTDVVIADLPCSGLGDIARKPDIRYRQTPESVSELTNLQRKILANAVRYVRPGGALLYATCTVTEAENAGNEFLSIGFRTQDVEAKREELLEKGLNVSPMVSPGPQVKFFHVTDPAGVRVQFM